MTVRNIVNELVSITPIRIYDRYLDFSCDDFELVTELTCKLVYPDVYPAIRPYLDRTISYLAIEDNSLKLVLAYEPDFETSIKSQH